MLTWPTISCIIIRFRSLFKQLTHPRLVFPPRMVGDFLVPLRFKIGAEFTEEDGIVEPRQNLDVEKQ